MTSHRWFVSVMKAARSWWGIEGHSIPARCMMPLCEFLMPTALSYDFISSSTAYFTLHKSWSTLIFLASRFAFLRRLLLAYPRIFTFGVVSHQGPSDAVMENIKYKIQLYGEGWEEGTDVKQKPNKRVVATVIYFFKPQYLGPQRKLLRNGRLSQLGLCASCS